MVLGQFTKSSMSSGRGGGIVAGEVWQSSGSVAGCCSLDGCDLLVYVCLRACLHEGRVTLAEGLP